MSVVVIAHSPSLNVSTPRNESNGRRAIESSLNTNVPVPIKRTRKSFVFLSPSPKLVNDAN